MSGIQADFTGAFNKTMALKNIPKATRYQLTKFGTDSVIALKRRAGQMQKGFRKTGMLADSVGITPVEKTGDYYKLTIGTGLGTTKGNRLAEKYASIQNWGGTIHVKKGFLRKGKHWSTWIKKMVFQTKDGKWHMADKVTIPPSYWFSGTMENREKFLHTTYLNDRIIWETAQKMSGGIHG